MSLPNSLPSGAVTFLFTDIEGSTPLWERHPNAMRAILSRHDALLREVIERRGGRVFKTVGDSFCAAFADAAEAVGAALAVQQAVGAEAWEDGVQLRVRIAVHAGIAQERDGDYFGLALSRVARLVAVGHGGQTLLSDAAQERIGDGLPAEVSLLDLGLHQFKDLGQPERIFQINHPNLPSEFPPLRSLNNPDLRHNLPRQLTSFIGREREIATIQRLLGATRLLTLTGMGGTGKTRISLQFAADALEGDGDGVWFVDLAPLADEAFVPQAVASALKIREEPGRALTLTLADDLRAKRLLLILDNCEHLLGACAALADALLRACPDVTILATSRSPLGVAGETTFPLPPLSLPNPETPPSLEELPQYEAVRLFVDRVQSAAPAFTLTQTNAPAVISICTRLDGAPLALELAAARVRAMPVEQLNRRLDDRFKILTGGLRTALPRQQTLRALIDWSHDLLTAPEKTLLRRLAVFAGGWTLDAAESVCAVDGLEEWEILDTLTGLVDKSLVVSEHEGGQARFRLLETIRQYARERLTEAGEEAELGERHLSFYIGLVEQLEQVWRFEQTWRAGGEENTDWDQGMVVEQENIRTALDWCRRNAQGPNGTEAAEFGLRLAGALYALWFYWGRFTEGRNRLEAALADAGDGASDGARAKALAGAGLMACMLNDYLTARGSLEESVTLCRRTGDRFHLSLALTLLGMVFTYAGDLDAGRGLLVEALELARAQGSRALIAFSLLLFGLHSLLVRDNAQADRQLTESIALYRSIRNRHLLGTALVRLGDLRLRQGDAAEAKRAYAESLSYAREGGGILNTARSLHGLSGVWAAQGEAGRAARLLAVTGALFERMGAMPPFEAAVFARNVAAARAALGEAAWAVAWEEGRAMGWEQAIPYALADDTDGEAAKK
ncbi:MAG: adenylate/guanylate cyclase domain-containing protein [Armatimonadota bacterium]|nr:adenylate/guanylate cyclase domain-containing protein [Armatimonadota bacterium]